MFFIENYSLHSKSSKSIQYLSLILYKHHLHLSIAKGKIEPNPYTFSKEYL